MHPLEGPLTKLRWAGMHLAAIDDLSAHYQSRYPYSMDIALNAEQTFYECRLVAEVPPFLDYGREIGEFAYQLRSALDQIIFALSAFPSNLTAKQLDSAERASGFPISLVVNGTYLDGRLKYVPASIKEDVRKAVDSVQPYKDAKRAEHHPLAVLDEINVRDKHRSLDRTKTWIRINRDNLTKGVEISSGSINHGDVLARVRAHLKPADEVQQRLTVDELIPVSRPAGGVGITTLHRIHECVRDEVLPAFERFFPPLPQKVKR